MPPIALVGLRAVYQNGQVRMMWDFPPNAPETVHIYAVKSRKEQLELDLRFHKTKDLRECSSGFSFQYSNISGNDVKTVEFCVYLSDHNEAAPDVRALNGMSECFIRVITGQADVIYQIRNKPLGSGLVYTQFVLKSTAEIDPGILGYSYHFNEKEIAVEFPGKIRSGITEYPPVVLTDHADPLVKVVAGLNSDIYVAQQKISGWRSFLARLLKKSRY